LYTDLPYAAECIQVRSKVDWSIKEVHGHMLYGTSLPSDLRHVAHHNTPSPTLNSPVYDLSTSLFLKKLKPISFTALFLLSLYSPRLSQD